VRRTILIPLLGYLIIFNSHVMHYLDLAKEIAGAPPHGGEVPTQLLLIYFGLCALAIGSIVYGRYCPDQVKHYGTSAAYVLGDGQSIGDFQLEAIEDELQNSALAARHANLRARLDAIRTERHQRVSQEYKWDDLREDLAKLKLTGTNEVLRIYFKHLDTSHPWMRGISGVLFMIGFIFLSIPSHASFSALMRARFLASMALPAASRRAPQIIPLPYRVESTSFMVTGCQAFGSRCDSL
jgi:hypothetical protein